MNIGPAHVQLTLAYLLNCIVKLRVQTKRWDRVPAFNYEPQLEVNLLPSCHQAGEPSLLLTSEKLKSGVGLYVVSWLEIYVYVLVFSTQSAVRNMTSSSNNNK